MPSTEACARWPRRTRRSRTRRPAPPAAPRTPGRSSPPPRGSGGSRAARPRRPPRARVHRRLRRRARRSRRRTPPGGPSSSARRAATGCDGCTPRFALPFGRPRCEARITVAPWSSAYWIVGSEARIRVSSLDHAALDRDVEVHAHEHALARADPGPIESFAMAASTVGRASRDPSTCRFRAPSSRSAGAGRRSGTSSPTRCRTRRAPSRSRRPSPWCRPRRASTSAGCRGSRSTRAARSDVLEDPLQRAVGRRLERRVDLVGRRLLVEEHDEVDHRDVRRRHAHREAVELALQLGDAPRPAPRPRPVVVGIIDSAAARARRRSLCGRSSRFWSFV